MDDPTPVDREYEPRKIRPTHIVEVTSTTIRCAPGVCLGPLPHLNEYRAIDINPNR